MKKKWKRCLGAVLAAVLSMANLGLVPAPRAQAASENLVKNPNFADSDLSMWSGSGATITVESQSEEICSGVTTYATISGRTQNYQGFLQDVTDVVTPGKEYEISYWVKLSEDFASLKASQREVFFGPYVVIDGSTSYLSQAYSGDITGNLLAQIPVGEWTQLSGTYTVAESANQVVLRFQQESSLGSYSITGVTMTEKSGSAPAEVVEVEDIPSWRDAITAALGEDTIAGMAMDGNQFNIKKEWALVQKHANGLTLGNELKPDALFGYSNGRCPGTETITFRGKSMVVPKMDFSRADKLLNKVLAYNDANPDAPIKIRGHVLLWHAQTPEWFFHVDYDPGKDYVSKEELDARQEWYIKSVFEHYLGKNSKYKDMFYGWDVVNEAASDSPDMVYRDDTGGNDKLTDSTHNSKSSWWHVYQSNEFIINAFKYANKYAPADLELYYNDYNDIWSVKVPNICALLQAIKDQEGAPGVGTRIDAFGMQAHYSLDDFDINAFESAARKYLDIVGKIQLTELDMKASKNYDGTLATRDQEYVDQARCYQQIFETLQKLDKEEGYEVGGITFWGVTDTTSWLQSRNDVGGGSDGLRSQCPLLFDGNYLAKPAYWAFVDPGKIPVVKKKVEVRRTYDGKFADGFSYIFEGSGISATLTPLWDQEGLKFQVEVKDTTTDGEKDYVTLYLDEANKAADGISPKTATMTRKESSTIGGGYKAVVKIPLEEIRVGKQFCFDIVVHDGDNVLAFSDSTGKQETSSENYASATLKPALTRVPRGTAVVDGEKDEVWNTAETFWLNIDKGAKASAKVKALWDTERLYIYAEIQDSEVSAAGKEAYEQDSLEIHIDENGDRAYEYDKDDKRYRISCENQVTCLGKKADEKYVTSAVKKTDTGYVIEASFDWTSVTPKVHGLVGFELRLNDGTGDGTRLGTASWYDETGEAGSSPACFGVIKLAAEGEPREESVNPDAVIGTGAAVETGAAGENGGDPEGEGNTGAEAKPQESTASSGKNNGASTYLLVAAALAAIAAWAGIARKKKGKKSGAAKDNKKENKKDPKNDKNIGNN